MVFKVKFQGLSEYETDGINLTFKELELNSPIEIPDQILSEISLKSENNSNIFRFHNIQSVVYLDNSNDFSLQKYKKFYVLLFSEKNKSDHEGFLIASDKKSKKILLGVWPFNSPITKILDNQEWSKKISNLVNNIENLSNICLIS
ncbi:MAG: hypothetical protein GF317_15920 [Candidatus Lokiarchaeota archaeon]|nr:hypothetical protein [Candidatus Lokiarchaeota archaeon]MBD3201035.1 hypothetical protein [Candidatus Lokiarchaeota archaeon]